MALADAQQAAEEAPQLFISAWALPELIEAASRTGQTRLAADALARLAEATSTGQTDWGQGIYARCRALLSDGQDAEDGYREAIDRLSHADLRPELARAHLLYGEWLRREGRRADARAQPRTAAEMFAAIGMETFAERARRELAVTSETVRKHTADIRDQLTPQEAQIARLARAGLSNPEIAAQLFPVHTDGRVAPAQSLRQARGQLPPRAPASAARRHQHQTDGITGGQDGVGHLRRSARRRTGVLIVSQVCRRPTTPSSALPGWDTASWPSRTSLRDRPTASLTS